MSAHAALPDSDLPHVGILRFEGPQAAAFCQSQLMNDVNALAIGDAQWNGWLSPKGRVIALGRLHRAAELCFDWYVYDHPIEPLREQLGKFVLRSKLRIEAMAGFGVLGIAQPALGDIPLGDGRALRAVATPNIAHVTHSDGWMTADFRLGLPRLPYPDGVESYTPHMLSLERLNAFSTRKGCYPGQEIVARTHFLGSSKRQLLAFEGEALAVGLAVFSDADGRNEVGRVLRATADGRHAQAVVSGEPECCFTAHGPLRAM